jgi:hypothetical protein
LSSEIRFLPRVVTSIYRAATKAPTSPTTPPNPAPKTCICPAPAELTTLAALLVADLVEEPVELLFVLDVLALLVVEATLVVTAVTVLVLVPFFVALGVLIMIVELGPEEGEARDVVAVVVTERPVAVRE